MDILAISGSLRATSSNTAVLQALAILAPRHGMHVTLYEGLGTLPHFNPDLDWDEPPPPVGELRQLIGRSAGLLISSPEYAHGVPGSLKNALDWLVASIEFPDKPVALIGASAESVYVTASLQEILTTMSARLVDDASITVPIRGRSIDSAGIAEDPELAPQLDAALVAFRNAIGHS
jgi:NAD(P)H-dependent FMN reductase